MMLKYAGSDLPSAAMRLWSEPQIRLFILGVGFDEAGETQLFNHGWV